MIPVGIKTLKHQVFCRCILSGQATQNKLCTQTTHKDRAGGQSGGRGESGPGACMTGLVVVVDQSEAI